MPVPRVRHGDLLPAVESLPKARYFFVVGAVPANFGGRTASILHKCRLLKELGGVDSTIVTLNYTSEIGDISAHLRRRGLLVDGVSIVNLHDYFEHDHASACEVVRHEVDEPGMEKIQDLDQAGAVYRYFEDGVHRFSKRFDDEGRLIVRDWFNEDGVRTRRDEFGANGLIRRTIHMDLHHNLPRQEVFYRSDGTLSMRKRFVVDPGARTARVDLITLVDGKGHPTKVLKTNEALKHLYLDSLVGDERAFLIVESRRSDRETLTYQRSNVKQIYVLHNPHLTPPGDDPSAIRGSYRQLFDHRDDVDAVVFLTKAQRADAEAEFGQRTNFRVIPHPMPNGQTAPFEDRDRDLVVMLARLDQQKQLSDAVVAFAEVVTVVPTARLEIYGQGPDRNKLQHQIDDLGLGTSVTLMGYTKDPTAVYRRAALSMLTSRFEGFGLVLLESLTHGCPVISYDVRYGPSDIITNGVNGYLVTPGDTHELAERVVEVLSDEPLRRQLSERAAQPDAEFSQETFVARWSELFRDLDGGP